MSKPIYVDVLGTQYEIIFTGEKEEPMLKENAGFCDSTVKKLYIKNDYVKQEDSVKNLPTFKAKVLRHELVHAFLYESGLTDQCYWAVNEEVVDWIAVQFPKINKAYREAISNPDCVEEF